MDLYFCRTIYTHTLTGTYLHELWVVCDFDRWNPDAIVFDSWQQYGTPGYWMQQFFKHSNNASLLYSTVQADAATNNVLIMSALRAKNDSTGSDYLVIKVSLCSFFCSLM